MSGTRIDPIEQLARETKTTGVQVRAVLELSEAGFPPPFIASYRKEKVGNLSEEKILRILDREEGRRRLEAARRLLLETLAGTGKSGPEVERMIEGLNDVSTLDSLIPLFRPVHRGAKTPRAKGPETKPEAVSSPEIPAAAPEPGEKDPLEEVGATEENLPVIPEPLEVLKSLREYREGAEVRARLQNPAKDPKNKYLPFHDMRCRLSDLTGKRAYFVRRGEKDGALKVEFLSKDAPVPVPIERFFRERLRREAEEEGMRMMERGMHELLLARPAGKKVVLGICPGFQSGTILAVVDAEGKVLDHRTIFPLAPQKEEEASRVILLGMVEGLKVEIVAVGRNNAAQEALDFVRATLKELTGGRPEVRQIGLTGAEAYAASSLARTELPALDATHRTAVSLARRVQDPLYEMLKVDVKTFMGPAHAVGPGARRWKRKLDLAVSSAVCAVGVDANRASSPMLEWVPGIDRELARALVEYREKNGRFSSKASLVKVPGFGPRAFELAAGFLRVGGAENPLDGSGIHPERYDLVARMCADLGVSAADVVGNHDKMAALDFSKYQDGETSLATLALLRREMEAPGADPRLQSTPEELNPEVRGFGDLKPGMKLRGLVTSVADFGVFAAVGKDLVGLAHISEIPDLKGENQREMFPLGGEIEVRVVAVDAEKKKIELSLRPEPAPVVHSARPPRRSENFEGPPRRPERDRGAPPPRPPRREHATLDQLKGKFSDGKEKKNNIKLAVSLKSLMRSGR